MFLVVEGRLEARLAQPGSKGATRCSVTRAAAS